MNKTPEVDSNSKQETSDNLDHFKICQKDFIEGAGIDVRSHFLELSQPPLRTHVLETGDPHQESPLLFVHGTGSFGAGFAPLMAPLQPTRMIAFDRPGFGLSEPMDRPREDLRRVGVQLLSGLIDELEVPSVDLIGHSMGGYLGIHFALSEPERVRRLILVGSVPTFPGTRPPFPIRMMSVPWLGELLQMTQKSGEEGVLDFVEIFGERETIQEYPALIRAMVAHEETPTATETALNEFRFLVTLAGWRSGNRITKEDLSKLQTPTTVIWGQNDTLGEPADVREGVEAIPEVQFETVESGHVPFLAHSETCAHLIQREIAPGARS